VKKTFAVLVVCALALISFGGCARKETASIRIGGWTGNPAEEAAMRDVVANFNTRQSEIQIVYEPIPGNYVETLKTRLAGGTAADLFYMDVSAFDEFALSGNLLPLDAHLRNFNLDQFSKPLLDAFRSKDRLYGLPKDFSTLALFYNKELFDSVQVPYPREGITYNEFFQLLRTLKARGIETPIVINADFNRLIPFVLAYGGNIVDENLNTALGETKARTAVNAYINLVVRDKVGAEASAVGSAWEGEAFGKEQVAMMMSGPWSIGFLRENFPNVLRKTGIVEMPVGEKKSTMIYTVSWSINNATRNRAAAIEVLKYLVTDGQKIFVERLGVLSSNKEIAKLDTDPLKIPFYRGAEYGTAWRVMTPSGNFVRANEEINARLRDAFYGKITTDVMINQIVENYNSWVR